MNTSSMRMASCTETKTRVVEEQPKSIAGGDGFSGIAVIAFATVTITIRILTDTLVSNLSRPTSRKISKNYIL